MSDYGDSKLDALQLALFSRRMDAICEEMGATLRRSAFSPNIRDRLDYSCALFDADGRLFAQAAHIPVHLGSMAYAMAAVVDEISWSPGDMVVFNDPFRGGTHLPDVTLVAPVFVHGERVAFVANRAHHADIGAASAGSMPVSSMLEEEGLIISPCHWMQAGELNSSVTEPVFSAMRNRVVSEGDFSSQVAANLAGVQRLAIRVEEAGAPAFTQQVVALNRYASALATNSLAQIPDGEYRFSDVLDDDGQGASDLIIDVVVSVCKGRVVVDFTGSAAQVKGNINCPLSVTAAAVQYVFRCLMPAHTPACAGVFDSVEIKAPQGCLLNARAPAAVAAGNVETSSRIVDVLLGALSQAMPDRVPAASQGTMNNVAMGGSSWDYYETIGGGMGAGPRYDGQSGVQSHMTNTLNTPIEVLESSFPLRMVEYSLRRGSGGSGRHTGGDGVCRSYRFLAEAEVTLLTERRRHAPWGLAGGLGAHCGKNGYNDSPLSAKTCIHVQAGDVISIDTPGGGGWGR